MAAILILYSTTDGHTATICQRLKAVLEECGHGAMVMSIDDEANVDLAQFDKIVVGASIRYGHHSKPLFAFIEKHHKALAAVPNAFFSVNAVARKPEKSTPETNPYLAKFLPTIPWKPQALEVFAGKINYPKYGPLDKMMIRFIMWMTKGPTGRNDVVDFTDWNKVEAFGRRIASL
ncbi:menaquinone-dependent protoporphyrinogen IX dehydrogenase [Pseudomonas sp. Marseille-QA0892]